MKTISMSSLKPESEKIEEAVRLIKKGGIVSFPTDTVYGVGVDAENKEAIDKLYRAKKRPKKKPLVLFITRKEEVLRFSEISSLKAKRLMDKFWPGPLTLILKASSYCPSTVINEEGKVGIRFPAHSIPQEIMKRGNLLLATTSANISGERSPLRAEDISESLKKGVDLLIDGGKVPLGKESTVLDVADSPPRLIREGYLSWERIRKVWDKEEDILLVCTGNTCRSPMAEGFLKRAWEGKRKIKIHSAGVATFTGLKATEFAIKVMREEGVDISNHLSTPLTEKMVREADLILVMETRHKEKICKIFPFAREKVILLKEFGLGRREEILDPVGGSLEEYRKCAMEIKEAAEAVAEKLKEN
ncbi:threonylcarbamoyl-AMP synthase [Candidatus Aerophobetes bacterium]|nr:threonylcarbamoyl-AMP synthase [Candidatus Aerophobetes bacterium]